MSHGGLELGRETHKGLVEKRTVGGGGRINAQFPGQTRHMHRGSHT